MLWRFKVLPRTWRGVKLEERTTDVIFSNQYLPCLGLDACPIGEHLKVSQTSKISSRSDISAVMIRYHDCHHGMKSVLHYSWIAIYLRATYCLVASKDRIGVVVGFPTSILARC